MLKNKVRQRDSAVIDWTKYSPYKKMLREEMDWYNRIDVTENLLEGGKFHNKAWEYYYQYIHRNIIKTYLQQEVISLGRTIPNPRILSIGCGYGGVELIIAESLNAPYELIGVDVNETLFSRPREQAKAKGLNVRFVALDFNFVEIEASSFDLIYAHSSLHHVLNLEHLMQQVYRGLKDGGRFIVMDIIGKKQGMFWKDNVAFAKEIIRKIPARYLVGGGIPLN
jgi:ubiquinone/menaquinone biosynthesis C-methylase UbiE